jgi:DNA-binding Xre family transcriptional regulator
MSSKIEHHRLHNESWVQIDKKTMAKICEALGVEVGKLFEYVEKK